MKRGSNPGSIPWRIEQFVRVVPDRTATQVARILNEDVAQVSSSMALMCKDNRLQRTRNERGTWIYRIKEGA